MKTRHPHKKAKGTTKLSVKPFHYNISAPFLKKKMLSKPCKARKKKTVKPDHVRKDDSAKDRSAKELAEHALLFYNQTARLTRSQEYQIVKDKSYNCYRADGASASISAWYHLNFVARCTPGTQESTFFAEIMENDCQLLVIMCQIVALTSEEIPCLAGCKICDKDECRDALIHPITGITNEFESETSSLQEDQPHISSFVWTKPLSTSSMKLKPIHDLKPTLTQDVKYDWKPEELALVALNFYNEAARLRKGPQYQFVKVTSYGYRFVGCTYTTWNHLNFIARPTSQAHEFAFFAEITQYASMLSVMRCQIVDDTPTYGGCNFCDDYQGRDLIHPITGVYKEY